jgi:uncharacterized protein
MLTITIVELMTLIVILPLAGGVVGYVIAGDRMRRQSGGKSPEELKTEFEDYQKGVTNHFQESAELLHQMTAQYRAIYAHLARGAAELSAPDEGNEQLAELKRLSLVFEQATADESREQTAAPIESAVKTEAEEAVANETLIGRERQEAEPIESAVEVKEVGRIETAVDVEVAAVPTNR